MKTDENSVQGTEQMQETAAPAGMEVAEESAVTAGTEVKEEGAAPAEAAEESAVTAGMEVTGESTAPAGAEVAEEDEGSAPAGMDLPEESTQTSGTISTEEEGPTVTLDRRRDVSGNPLCLSGHGVTRVFGSGSKQTVAVDHVDFEFREGELVSIVGESGSGKTTLSRMLLGLLSPTDGEIYFRGEVRDISTRKKKKEYWHNIQAIFQDPFSSFNVFNKIDTVLLDCINMTGGKKLPWEKKVEMMTEACSFVNLKFAELTNKYPFELSGGQMQRLMIARIFLLKPKILLADEPTSMIDACSRATILDMLLNLRDEIGMTVIFITHDIGLAYYISDTVYIMEHGKFVEHGTADEVILTPKADYTRRLISDVPKIHEAWDLSTVE